MATPRYTSLKSKVRDWSNKREVATIPESVIEDCLGYSADDCYRDLRIPPLETSVEYVVGESDNDDSNNYTRIPIPSDLVEFIYIRELAGSHSIVYHEVTDSRTFFDDYSEKYNANHWMWKDDYLYIRPKLNPGDEIEIQYYRKLPRLDAVFAVIPINWVQGFPDKEQPFLDIEEAPKGSPLYFAGSGVNERAFATEQSAQAYANTQPVTTVTTKYWSGKESPNWLRDTNERLLIWGALRHVGAYLFDEVMELRYEKKYNELVTSLNKEEKFRRARGGNVQINVNTNGLI